MLTVRCPDETQPMSKRSALLQSEHFSTYYAVPLIAKGQVKGVLELFQHNIGTPDAEWVGFLEALAMQAAIAIDNANLFDDLQQANTDLALAYDATLEGWVHALDLRDNETEGHTQRVTEATVRLARNMGFSAAELVHVRRGALLHDIGKMAIPDKILLKPGPLTDEEWEIMRRHPVYAYDWLAPIAFLRPSLDIPYCHHERWDGSGYPRGLRGEAIPLLARIFAVVDVWDALRSDRPYRRRWPEAEVRDYIQSQAGTQFDPQIVAQFLQADLTSDVMLCLNGEYRQPGMAAPDPGAGYDASTIPEVGSQEDGTMLSYCCNRTSQPGRF
jgi:HD-GYP domain-containing protein (c-di-GMP phosphodiesterase class II)